MGVLYLWPILSPVAKHCHLESLRGKTLAVDLSGWICESYQVKGLQTSKNPYLRNLFFRIAKLLQYGINLVFVLEGTAPDLKEETLSQRQESRVPSQTSSSSSAALKERPLLRSKNRECQKLLDTLGIPYIQSPGEAEAMCAYLNMKGIVDGCLTEDSDIFLYGGLTAYRDLSTDSKDPHVNMYTMADVEKVLGLDRMKLIGLALLTGCDYYHGVQGVGRETAVKLLSKLKNVDIIQRFKSWKTDKMFESLEKKTELPKKTKHCETCSHPGSLKKHMSDGCHFCGTEALCKSAKSNDGCSCDYHSVLELREEWKLELSVRQKSLGHSDFPPEMVIKEFLDEKISDVNVDMAWKKPDYKMFLEFVDGKLNWTEEQCWNRMFPILAKWQILHGDKNSTELKPEKILKLRVQRGQPLYEVAWISEDKHEDVDLQTTLEPQEVFQEAYPDLVEQFLKEQEAKKSNKSKKEDNQDIREFFKVSAGKPNVIKESQTTVENLHLKPDLNKPKLITTVAPMRRKNKKVGYKTLDTSSLPSIETFLSKQTGKVSDKTSNVHITNDRNGKKFDNNYLVPLKQRLQLKNCKGNLNPPCVSNVPVKQQYSDAEVFSENEIGKNSVTSENAIGNESSDDSFCIPLTQRLQQKRDICFKVFEKEESVQQPAECFTKNLSFESECIKRGESISRKGLNKEKDLQLCKEVGTVLVNSKEPQLDKILPEKWQEKKYQLKGCTIQASDGLSSHYSTDLKREDQSENPSSCKKVLEVTSCNIDKELNSSTRQTSASSVAIPLTPTLQWIDKKFAPFHGDQNTSTSRTWKTDISDHPMVGDKAKTEHHETTFCNDRLAPERRDSVLEYQSTPVCSTHSQNHLPNKKLVVTTTVPLNIKGEHAGISRKELEYNLSADLFPSLNSSELNAFNEVCDNLELHDEKNVIIISDSEDE